MKKDCSFLTENIIAHRGMHDIKEGIPENSMIAFEKAIQNNYIIELDVHILKDGNVVVFHDDNLKRLTNMDVMIKDMNYNELKRLKLQNTEQRIPLLEEVLNLINGKVPVIIELKYDNKCGLLEEKVIKILKSYHGKYALKSFNPLAVNYIRKKAPEIVRGQLASDFKGKKMNIFKRIFLSNMLFNIISRPDFISYDVKALPNKRLAKIRKNKIVLGWTIRDKETLKKAKKYCDNFICENILILKEDLT